MKKVVDYKMSYKINHEEFSPLDRIRGLMVLYSYNFGFKSFLLNRKLLKIQKL